MFKRRIIAIVFAAALFLGCATNGFSVGSTDKIVYLSEELQAKENVALEKYNKMLAAWAGGREVFSDMEVDFPEFYAGSFINENKDFVIQLTALTDKTRKYFAEIIDTNGVIFEEVKYSIYDLKKEHTAIVERWTANKENKLISNVSGVGISFSDNAVNLYVISTIKDKKGEAAFTEEVKNAITSFENINIITTGGYTTPLVALEPGAVLSGAGSVGFWALKGSQYGIVTHAHAVSSGQAIAYGSYAFGYAGTPVMSGKVDAVFVPHTLNTANITKSRYVSGHNFNLYPGIYSSVAQGATAYTKGATTGSFSGVVADTSMTIQYPAAYGNVVLTDMVRTMASTWSGDSGGVVAGGGSSSQRYLVGINAGSQAIGGTGNNQLYCKAGNILSALGVSPY